VPATKGVVRHPDRYAISFSRSHGGTRTITLSGEIDMLAESELGDQLADFQDSQDSRVQVDLQQVTFVDTTGFAFFARLRRVAEARGGTLLLLRPTSHAQRVLRLLGFVVDSSTTS
jgi:anti-anti-sigma factor